MHGSSFCVLRVLTMRAPPCGPSLSRTSFPGGRRAGGGSCIVVFGALEVEAVWPVAPEDTQVSLRTSAFSSAHTPTHSFPIKKKILTQMNFLYEINFFRSPEVIFNNLSALFSAG